MSDEKKNLAEPGEEDEKATLKTEDEKNHTEDAAGVMDGGPDLDGSKVKFINSADDATIDLGKPKDEFVGLTKEELMQYAKDPFWVRLRLAMLILFWVCWFGMLAAAIIIIALAPRCPHRPNLEWWQKSVVYQAYPRSFKDDVANDGVGDLKGIENNLNYLKDTLNSSAVWINPIYMSGGLDTGYDIIDHLEIDPVYGTKSDFHNLLAAMRRRNMHLIVDFVPNHVSDQHPWFVESKKSPDQCKQYCDYFVWAKGNGANPPNNWKSVFGGPAWTYVDERKEWYLHQFLPQQPDLNVRSPAVKDELKAILEYWLTQGVDGFRVDAAAHLYEANITMNDPMNEPVNNSPSSTKEYDQLDHIYTTCQPETYELITVWREILDRFATEQERAKFMVVEGDSCSSINKTLQFYEYDGKKGADFPFNMALTQLGPDKCDGNCVYDKVHQWMGVMPDNVWPNWVVGNHDTGRMASRVGDAMVNAVNMLYLTLPGTATVYYGDEIGMKDTTIPADQVQDKVATETNSPSRDPERTPMQWSSAKNAGFSDANSTWLPVNSDYVNCNVRLQQAHGSGMSNIEVFSSLTLLRQEPSFQWGKYHDVFHNAHVFSYVRQAEGFDGYLVVINFGSLPAVPDFHAVRPDIIPSHGVIAGHTHNFGSNAAEFAVGTNVELDRIRLKPGEGIIFKWAFADLPEE